jgi:DNA-binding NtrC family response regulator
METTAREESAPLDGPEETPLAWSLTVVHHADPALIGQRVVLEPLRPLLLGRRELCFGPGALDDVRVSRRHAQVVVDGAGALLVEDLRSQNGTRRNGVLVETATLVEDDVLGIGSTLLLAHRAPAVYRVIRHPTLAGVGHRLARVLHDVARIAPHPTTVLVLGETGTGKELVAGEIHASSGRRGALCVLNCGALPDTLLHGELFGHVRGAFSGADADRPGLAEAAQGGTLFLDEIGDASPALQTALLRFLERGEVRRLGSNRTAQVDTRVVAATHRDLARLVAAGTFREDLLARLSRWVIEVPPLRDRREDIPHIARHVLAAAGDARPLHPRLALALLRAPWPRNVRELSAVVHRAQVESEGDIDLSPAVEALLSSPAREAPPAPEAGRAARSGAPEPPTPRRRAPRPTGDELRALLARHEGNVTALAASLGVGRNTLYRWLRAEEIERS